MRTHAGLAKKGSAKAASAQQTGGATAQRTRCEVWTRVMGYHRPVSQFNKGKKAEHYGRTHFRENVSMKSSHAS